MTAPTRQAQESADASLLDLEARPAAASIVRPLIVGLVAFAVSANSLRNGFALDDHQLILQNPWIRDPSRLGEAFTHHLAAFDPRFQTSYYRPLVHVLYAVCYAANGLSPFAYHLASVLAHAAVAVAVYVLLARFSPARVSSSGDRERTAPGQFVAAGGPLIGALLFAVHPAHAEAVAWAGAIMDVAAALFVLLAFLAVNHDGAPRVVRLGGGAVLFLAGMLWKEPAAMLLPVVLAVFLCRGEIRRARSRDAAGTLAALAFAAVAYLLLRVHALGGLTAGDRRVVVDGTEGALTAVALLGAYLKTLVWPVHLTPLHEFAIARSVLDARVLLGAALIAALAVVAWRGRRHPGVVAGLALLLFPLAPALYVPALGEGLFSERYLYLPSVGAALLFATAWNAFVPSGRYRRTSVAVAGALILACGAASVDRNAVWLDGLSLWTDTVRKVPRSALAHESLGYALLTSGRPAEAVASLSTALALDPTRTDARVNLASALAAVGRIDDALRQAQFVIQSNPARAEAHSVIGWAYLAQGRIDDAIVAYERALSLNPSLAAAHNALGVAYARLGALERAASHLEAAVRLEPENASYAHNLATFSR